MSVLLMRPPNPVPGTVARSMLFSRAMRRTSGEERISSAARAIGWGAAGRGVGADTAVAGTGCGARGAWVGAGAGAEGTVAGAPAPPITATTVLTWTVVPSFTLISRSTPADGAGISASTL